MSSNDMLIIRKNGKRFEVCHHLCVDIEFVYSKKARLGLFDTLPEAIRFANAFCNEFPYVEYGYKVLESALE